MAPVGKANPQGDFFVHPDEGLLDDPFAEVNAFYHADQFAEWFAFHFGLRTPQMQIFTGFPMTNAFFGDFDGDGKRDLSFGVTDDGLNFAHDSDVVIHEYGHAIVRELAGGLSMDADHLGLDWTAGALNEGIADTFSMLINPDGLLGESMACRIDGTRPFVICGPIVFVRMIWPARCIRAGKYGAQCHGISSKILWWVRRLFGS